jgi:hypothetical protein
LETKEVKHRLERAKEPLPDLEESDVDSDGDSLSLEPVIESGGDERDFWSDHPVADEDETNLPEFEPVDSPLRVPEEAPPGSPIRPPPQIPEEAEPPDPSTPPRY